MTDSDTAAKSGGEPDGRSGRRQRPGRYVRIRPRGDGPAPILFRQGGRPPYGVRWYGITSLYGHFRNFIARAIASESVDARDWMRPATPEKLLASMLETLQPGAHPAAPTNAAQSLAEALDRPVVIDFVADTGDDRDTSQAVGSMIAHDYVLEDGTRLPRGEVLLFGGDIAYPVATANEIHLRLTQPWNMALREVRQAGRTKKRVLLGVPGNHDWYDGLDGFGRLFREAVDLPLRHDGKRKHRGVLASIAKIQTVLAPRLDREADGRARKVGVALREFHFDELLGFLKIVTSLFRFIFNFAFGVPKKRRRRLVLHGYMAKQQASYFAFPLARNLYLFGADRQLGRIDFRQRTFFRELRAAHPTHDLVFLSADPAMAYGEANEPGAQMLEATGLDPEQDKLLYLSGDFHHYERRRFGLGTHVIAGGGGAFLHGTRIAPYPKEAGPPEAVYPTGPMSSRLLRDVPWKLLIGRSGFLVHLTGALLGSIALAVHHATPVVHVATVAAVLATTISVLWLIAGYGRAHPRSVAAVAVPFGVAAGIFPFAADQLLDHRRLLSLAAEPTTLLTVAFGTALIYGLFLVVVARLGLEHQQAFTVLGHGGFKHFVRMIVHPSGKVEGFTLGKDDPIADGPPALIDRFVFEARPPNDAGSEE